MQFPFLFVCLKKGKFRTVVRWQSSGLLLGWGRGDNCKCQQAIFSVKRRILNFQGLRLSFSDTSEIPKSHALHANHTQLPIVWLASLPYLQLESRHFGNFGNSLLLFCAWLLPQHMNSFSDHATREKSSCFLSCMHAHTCINTYTYMFLILFFTTSAFFGYLKCSGIMDEDIRESP